tara:strand:- start:74 stop:661 length:588 start_codon:yes stop_codon:yes gene_type:complete
MKIIQIGANNGKDEVFDFINQHNDSLELAIIVEPIPFENILSTLTDQYKNINNSFIENIAISHEEEVNEVDLYYQEDSNYEVSSFNYEHTKSHSLNLDKQPILRMKVKCCTINQLMDKYNIKDLDYLFIDTEGLDVHIINSIKFKEYNIKNIIFEAVHTDGPFKKGNNFVIILQLLFQLGYSVKSFNAFDLIASK